MFSKDEIDAMTPAEASAAREINAAEEAGQDVFGDGEQASEPAGQQAKPEDAQADEPKEEPKAEEEAKEEAKEVEDENAPNDAPFVPTFEGRVPDDYETSRKALRQEKAKLRQKWSAGEMDDDAFNTAEAAVDDQLDALRETYLTAKAMQEAQLQMQRSHAQRVISTIRAQGAKEGLDYGPADKPTAAAAQFDGVLRGLADEPEWQDKEFDAIAQEAHRRVMAFNGKTKQATSVVPVAQPANVERPKPAAPPQTLRELPTAERANAGDDLETQWAAATGHKAEALWARMSPAQQERLLSAAN